MAMCRVGAVVDMVQRYVELFKVGPHAVRPHIMQALEADVVKHVTAFYTYMKVTRDTLRKLADIKPLADGGHHDDWHRAICSVFYMQFLGLESARNAIKDLVGFEPTQAEDMITVLLSELPAYGFLREQFKDDLRQRRLASRDLTYRKEVPALHDMVMSATGTRWDAAKDLAAA
jgi:hypothetical protein